MAQQPRERAPRIAGYQADPESVARVCLLYSGGLDTSVMLRWIQEEYGAEIVTLTVNLGQPGEDWDEVTGKAKDLGAVEAILIDAREQFAEMSSHCNLARMWSRRVNAFIKRDRSPL